MRRTLQTTQSALSWLIEQGIALQVRGEWQGIQGLQGDSVVAHRVLETSAKPCDTGTPTSTLATEFAGLDFSSVFPAYPSKTGRWAPSQDAVAQRASDCRRWLRGRSETVIAVVSHSAFLEFGVSSAQYANADFRLFDFAEDGSDCLVEWDLTQSRGGAMGRSPKEKKRVRASDIPRAELVNVAGEDMANKTSMT